MITNDLKGARTKEREPKVPRPEKRKEGGRSGNRKGVEEARRKKSSPSYLDQEAKGN